MSKPGPARGAERRRVAWVRFRNRVRATTPGKLTNFLPFFIQLPLLVAMIAAIPVVAVVEGIDLWQREGFAKERVARLDAAVAQAAKAGRSPYCQGLFGAGPFYAPCAAGERHSLTQFSRAWSAGRGLSTLRDHMINCYEMAQKEQGTSWRIASVCAGADQPSPNDTYSEG